MDTEEFLAETQIINDSLHKLSNAVEEGITKNPDYNFLKGKLESIYNTSDHVLGQLRYRIRVKKSGKI